MTTGQGDQRASSPQSARGDPGSEGRIRIVFGIDNFNVGGTELNAVRTAERLDPARFDITVASLQESGPLRARYAAAGKSVVAFPISALFGRDAIRQGLRLYRFLRNERIDIFHAHDIYSNIFGVPWARLAGTRVIASRRWWANRPLSGLERANRVAYHVAHRVLANSPGVARFCRENDGIPASRVAVVSNFLDEVAFSPLAPEERAALRDSLGVPAEAVVIGILANLSPIKDHATLLRAVAPIARRWPDLRVVAVGDGKCRQALEDLARELQIGDRVIFAGRLIGRANLHHLFEISSLCSRSEAFPNSVLEAMAASRPVVATDVGAVSDAVINRETGLLVPPGDSVRLADAIEHLLREPRLAQQMGAAGRRRAQELYSAEAALGALERLYGSLLRGGPANGIGNAPQRGHIAASLYERTRVTSNSMTTFYAGR